MGLSEWEMEKPKGKMERVENPINSDAITYEKEGDLPKGEKLIENQIQFAREFKINAAEAAYLFRCVRQGLKLWPTSEGNFVRERE